MKSNEIDFHGLSRIGIVVIIHMGDVEGFLIGNIYHNYEHNQYENDEVVATNVFEKLA